jgi:integrase
MLYQRGKEKRWWYRFRFGGRIVHESAKTTSKTVARDAERQRRRQLEESWNQITRRTLPPTFDKAGRQWLEGREGRFAPGTMALARVSLHNHLLPAFGSKLLPDIQPKDIEAYQQARLREGAANRTINIEVQVLRQVLKANDCVQSLQGKVRSLRENKDIGRALSPEEESRLLEECAQADSACYTAVVLALNTTMRADEIRQLRWQQVDLFEGELTVGKSKTEAGSGRVIPLNPSAVKALADWGNRFPGHQPGQYVFPWCESRRVDPSRPTRGWRTAWESARERAGLKIRFHDLRHTAITKLAEGQASDETIMSIAGHVSKQMLHHYSHIRREAKRAAVNAISTPLPQEAQTREMSRVQIRGVHQIGNQIETAENSAAGKLLN